MDSQRLKASSSLPSSIEAANTGNQSMPLKGSPTVQAIQVTGERFIPLAATQAFHQTPQNIYQGAGLETAMAYPKPLSLPGSTFPGREVEPSLKNQAVIELKPLSPFQKPKDRTHNIYEFCSYISREDFLLLQMETQNLIEKLMPNIIGEKSLEAHNVKRLFSDKNQIMVLRLNGKPQAVTHSTQVKQGEILVHPLHQEATGSVNDESNPGAITVQALNRGLAAAVATTVKISLPEGASPVKVEEKILFDQGMRMFEYTPVESGRDYKGNYIVSTMPPTNHHGKTGDHPPRELVLRMTNSMIGKGGMEPESFFIGPHANFITEEGQAITIVRETIPSLDKAVIRKKYCRHAKNCLLVHKELYAALCDGSSREATLVSVDGEYYYAMACGGSLYSENGWKDASDLNHVFATHNFNDKLFGTSCIKTASGVQLPTAGHIKVQISRDEKSNNLHDSWDMKQLEAMTRCSLEYYPVKEGRGFDIDSATDSGCSSLSYFPLSGNILSVTGMSSDRDSDQESSLPFQVTEDTRVELEINDPGIINKGGQDPGQWTKRVGRVVGGAEIAIDRINKELLNNWLSFHGSDAPVENNARGCVVYGDPGNGKTLLVQAILDEWINCGYLKKGNVTTRNGADFLKFTIEESIHDIKKLFSKAKEDYDNNGKNAALHVFYLEEAEGLFRDKSDEKSTNESEAAVNTFLSQLDGENHLPNIMVFVTTNHLDVFESSVLRKGRLGLQIALTAPTAREREEILRIRLDAVRQRGWNTERCSLYEIAQQTSCKSGAALGDLVNQAVFLALQEAPNSKTLTTEHLKQALFNEGESKTFLKYSLEKFPLKYGNEQLHFTTAQQEAIDTLKELSSITVNGSNSVVAFVHGDMGTGKSAVMHEVLRSSPGYDVYSAASDKTCSDLPSSMKAISRNAAKYNKSCLCLDGLETLLKAGEDPRALIKPGDISEQWQRLTSKPMSSNFLMISTRSPQSTFIDTLGWRGLQFHVSLPDHLTDEDMRAVLEKHYDITEKQLQDTVLKSVSHSPQTLDTFHRLVTFGFDKTTKQWKEKLIRSAKFFRPEGQLPEALYS